MLGRNERATEAGWLATSGKNSRLLHESLRGTLRALDRADQW